MTRTSISSLFAAVIFATGMAGCSSSSPSQVPSDGGGVAQDASTDAGGSCTGTPPTCPKPCDAGLATPDCINGVWACPPEPAIACVIGSADAGLTCGSSTCDPTTTYCQNDNGGAHPIDGGSASSYTCTPLPTHCDGGAVSCACVNSGGCNCTDDNGAITVVCDFP